MDVSAIQFFLQLLTVIVAIMMGVRAGGVGLGLWAGIGLLVLAYAFGLTPTSPPIDVMLIIIAVIMAASVMEAAGGIDYLVDVAASLIRRNPNQITWVAPIVAWLFTVGAGTGHIFYPLIPIIYETAYENEIRPERPLSVSVLAGIFAIMASPVSAATAAMISLFEPEGFGLVQILAISMPATLVGILVAALIQMRRGKSLKDDPEYQRRLAAGEIQPPGHAHSKPEDRRELPPYARMSAFIFLAGVAFIVLCGLFPAIRPQIPDADGVKGPLSMTVMIQITMLSVAAIMLLFTKTPASKVPRTNVAISGFTAVVAIFGIAWMSDTFISANETVLVNSLEGMVNAVPMSFAIALFFMAAILNSQAATTRTLMPLGLALGLPPEYLIAMWPAVAGVAFLPIGGTLIASVNFDQTGTTRIGKYVLNHSFMIPLIIATVAAVLTGMGIATLLY
jgi:anaerobic C4-dicarboxylate transporter-like protein